MFTIVPILIIFLCSAYLYLNEVSTFTIVLVYTFEITMLIGLYYLYKVIQSDLKEQEKNKIKQEISTLEQKLSIEKDQVIIKNLEQKIQKLNKAL